MTTVLKLGGSVITDKTRRETLDGEALNAAADAIATAYGSGVDRLVVVHGGGSFGHPHAEDHGVSTTGGTTDAAAVLEIHGAMKTLNRFVLVRLHERDVPALPVHSLSAGCRDEGGTLTHPFGQVRTMLGEGFVPVLHGDVVAHAGAGATVVSGDELVVAAAEEVDADRVGLCSTVPGVLDESGEVIDHIESFAEAEATLGDSEATDVSGGMAGKVRTLLSLSVPANVFGADDLAAFLDGESPGTLVGTGESR
ncbi:MAG: isopentenyl phosphate kinase [Haloferacaceae archaeon]